MMHRISPSCGAASSKPMSSSLDNPGAYWPISTDPVSLYNRSRGNSTFVSPEVRVLQLAQEADLPGEASPDEVRCLSKYRWLRAILGNGLGRFQPVWARTAVRSALGYPRWAITAVPHASAPLDLADAPAISFGDHQAASELFPGMCANVARRNIIVLPQSGQQSC